MAESQAFCPPMLPTLQRCSAECAHVHGAFAGSHAMNGPFTGSMQLAPGSHAFQANYFQVRVVHLHALPLAMRVLRPVHASVQSRCRLKPSELTLVRHRSPSPTAHRIDDPWLPLIAVDPCEYGRIVHRQGAQLLTSCHLRRLLPCAA